MKSIQPFLGVCLLGLITLGIGACSSADEADAPAAAEPAASAPAPAPAPEQSAGAPDSTQEKLAKVLAREMPLPEGYPSDAPIYPGAKINIGVPGSKNRVSVVFHTADAATDVADYMSGELKSSGWKLITDGPMGDVFITKGTKGEREVSVVTSRQDTHGVTLVAVVVTRS